MLSAYLTASSPVIHCAGLSAVSDASDGTSPPNSREGGWRLYLEGSRMGILTTEGNESNRAGTFVLTLASP